MLHLLMTPSFYAGVGVGFMLSALLAAYWETHKDKEDDNG
jgi:hypothetical protein